MYGVACMTAQISVMPAMHCLAYATLPTSHLVCPQACAAPCALYMLLLFLHGMARMQAKLQGAPTNVKLKDKHDFVQDCHYVELQQVQEKSWPTEASRIAHPKHNFPLRVASDWNTSLEHCQDTVITHIGPCALTEEHRVRPIWVLCCDHLSRGPCEPR